MTWCDSVIWTPRVNIQSIFIDFAWSLRYVLHLEDFYSRYLVRKDDSEYTGLDSVMAIETSDAAAVEPVKQAARHLLSTLHLIGLAWLFLRHRLVHLSPLHLQRWLFQMQSISRAGFKWPKAGDHFLNHAIDNLFETCVQKLFNQRVPSKESREFLVEVGDFIINIEKAQCVWSTFFHPDFAWMVK